MRILLALLLWASAAAAEFAEVTPGRALRFPQDHGPHEAFRNEWWYVTATLEGPDGARYGAQWTLFRSSLRPPAGRTGWDSEQVFLGHAAVTSAHTHRSAERYGRGGVGQAGVTLDPFEAWIDDWALLSAAPPDADPLSAVIMTAQGPDFAFRLGLTATGPLVLHGDAGYSLKSERGQASYYYSQPFFEAEGVLEIDGEAIPVSGRAWLDREWSSQSLGAGDGGLPLSDRQTGWDWFSLSLDDGGRVMLYRIRTQEGVDGLAGTWIAPDGAAEPLDAAAIEMTPVGWAEAAGRRIPVRWRLALPDRGLAVETEPLNPDSWNALGIPYWEGPIRVSGTHAGVGYLEMTGY